MSSAFDALALTAKYLAAADDALARIIGEKLATRGGQSVLIENRTGASGSTRKRASTSKLERISDPQSIVSPPSHCPHCKYSIPFYLNIPLLTWLSLRGKCANCRAPISAREWSASLVLGLFASVLGALLGYAIGFYLFEAVGSAIIFSASRTVSMSFLRPAGLRGYQAIDCSRPQGSGTLSSL